MRWLISPFFFFFFLKGPREEPGNLTITETSHNSLSIEWQPITSANDDVINYGIQYRILEQNGILANYSSVTEIVVPSSVRQYHFSNLQSNVLYEIRVFGINDDGYGVPNIVNASK